MRKGTQEIIDSAKEYVAQRSKSLPHKIRTMAWYAGRKSVQRAPKILLVQAVRMIPTVGPVLAQAVNPIVDKIQQERHKKKREASLATAEANPKSLESLRKAAKEEAKDLSTVITQLEQNQVKLKDAAIARKQSLETLNAAFRESGGNPEVFYKGAYAIYEAERYEDKVLALIELARAGLNTIEDYVKASIEDTVETEKAYIELLDWEFRNEDAATTGVAYL